MEATFPNMPFGEMVPNNYTTSLGATEQQFTGKERDTESGLDYFGARYYGSSMGRFMSPDWNESPLPLPFADLDNPQSFNFYSYVLNNPLGQSDEDGHRPVTFCKPDTTVDNGDGSYTVIPGKCTTLDDGSVNPGDLGLSFYVGGRIGSAVGSMAIRGLGLAWRAAAEFLGFGAKGTGGALGEAAGTVSGSGKTIVQRVMSREELANTKATGLLRGGRPGTHFLTDSAPDSAVAAQQQLALPTTPEVRVTMEVDSNAVSSSSPVTPDYGQPGGGTQRTATGPVAVKILKVEDLK